MNNKPVNLNLKPVSQAEGYPVTLEYYLFRQALNAGYGLEPTEKALERKQEGTR